MAASGYTPIILFNSGTTGHTPTTGNLAVGELAINYTDGKLYYNTGSAIAILANAASQTPVTTFSAGTTGFTPSTATSGAVTLSGTLATSNGGTGLSGSTPFTANGVVYASSTSALATGSALTFNGTNLSIGLGASYLTANSNYGFGTPDSAGLQIFTASGDSIRFGSRSSGTFTEQARFNSSGYLGIGTSSPGSQLEVSSSNTAIRVTDTSTGYAWTRYTNNSTNFFVGMDNSTGSQFGTAYARVLWGQGAYPMVFATNNTEQMRLDNSGNLGLGVTPSAWGSSYKTLAINSECNFYASSNQGGVTLNAYNDNTNWRYATSDYATRYLQYQGAHYWNIAGTGTAGGTISFTQAMILDNSGNLGIGTTAPGAKLDVNGRINTNNIFTAQYAANTAYYAQLDSLDANTNLKAIGSGAVITFQTASTVRATIDSSGNLGLGVTPSAWGSSLKIEQFPNGSAVGDYNNAAGISYNYYNAGGGGDKYIANGYATRYFQTSGQHQWYNAPSGTAGTAINSGAGFIQAMTLDNSGRLMVGYTSPYGNGKLTLVASTTPTSGTDSNNQLFIGEATHNASYYMSVGYINASGGGYGGSLQSISGGNPANLYLNPAGGSVGIGTSNPAVQFTVQNSSTSLGIETDTNSGFGSGPTIRGFYRAGSAYTSLALTGSSVLFGINDVEKMRIDSSGNLLVGTTSAINSGKISISAALYTTSAGITIQNTQTTYGSSTSFAVFVNSGGGTAGNIYQSAGTTVNYNTSSDARLKQDIGVATDTSVIDNTIIHDFTWKADSRVDRGVFAQEAYEVKPSAVGIGKDDLTESGELLQPWSVDYSKYVPDLIVYCQQLNKRIQQLEAKGA
jgi:hypothetical protein